jgi:transcriptional antiterminator RfaH
MVKEKNHFYLWEVLIIIFLEKVNGGALTQRPGRLVRSFFRMTDENHVNTRERWFAVYTKRQKEQYVDTKLLQLDLETFLPLIRTRIRRKFQLRPLFPCYVFARFDPERWLYSINHLEGVNRVVAFADRPLAVPDEMIRRLRERIGDQGYFVPEQKLVTGDKIRILNGVFAGYEGHIEELRPRDRVVVMLRTIFSQARLEIDVDLVEAIRHYTP